MDGDDFEITPAIRAYLAAFDRCLRATEDQARAAHEEKAQALHQLRQDARWRRVKGWHAPLSEREAEALELRLHGLQRPEIAKRMGISIKTVARYFNNIHERLETGDPYRVTLWAIGKGFLIREP